MLVRRLSPSFVSRITGRRYSLSECLASSASERPQAVSSEIVEPEVYETLERKRFVFNNITASIEDKTNRLFAVVYINSKQFKVSQNDIIQLEYNVPLDVGDEIKFEKVLLVAGFDFTLVGRPLLDTRYVGVNATVIEKTTTSPDVRYDYQKHSIHHPNWLSRELTVLRINQIFLDKAIMGEIQ